MPARHLVFDVNETLLDLSPLDPVFAELFGQAAWRPIWFKRLLHWSTVTTLTGQFMDFGTLAGHCLDQTAAEAGVTLETGQSDRVFSTIATLEPHADVAPALEALRTAGFSLTALTNSAQSMVDAQFERTNLTARFDRVLSVEAARCYKPHPAAYAVATKALGVEAGDLRLVAAHDWDVTGALRAGLAAAFVARNGATLNAAGDTPDIVGDDLQKVADEIIRRDR